MLLSWPVIVLVLGLVLSKRFKDQIAALIDRIAKIELPWGGGTVQTPQQIANVQADAAQSPVPATTPEAVSANEQDATTLRALAIGEKNRAAFFEYQYLNLYLVPHTQLVLDWIAGLDRSISTREYDAWWMQRIPVPDERRAIVFALANHHLVSLTDNYSLITLTPKGREYLEWRGPLSALLAARRTPPGPLAGLMAARPTPATPEPAAEPARPAEPAPAAALPREPDGPSK